MNVGLDDDEREILETVRAVAAAKAPLSVEGGRPWRPLFDEASRLGFFGLHVPEPEGGLGLGDFHAGLVAYGFGSQLAPGPWLEHLVAVAAAAGTELGRALVSGDLVAGELLSSRDRAVPTDGAHVAMPARRLSGEVDLWLLPAELNGDLVLAAVHACDVRYALEPACGVDLGSTAVVCSPVDAPVMIVGATDEGNRRRLMLLASGLAALFEIGACERLLADTAEFAKTRTQFGRPIGAFQAVKHRLADLYIEIEHARSLALAALAVGGPARERLAPMSKLLADDVYRVAAEACIQLHGGFGFTWECPVHLFLKNALRMRTYPVSAEQQRAAIRRVLGLNEAGTNEHADRTEELV